MEQSASNRYELTWSRFVKELETNPKTTLRAVCKLQHTPSVHHESSLLGISITFNSGTTINIKQGDADSIIRLISLYERKDGDSCTL